MVSYEYASCAWDPNMRKQVSKIRGVQCSAERFVKAKSLQLDRHAAKLIGCH